VLFDYLATAMISSVPVSSYLNVKRSGWRLHGDDEHRQPIASEFYLALKGFTALLRLEQMPCATFCQECGRSPNTVLMDATSATIAYVFFELFLLSYCASLGSEKLATRRSVATSTMQRLA
jgi:hypothetical protein